jgi:hypothetical protein
MGPARITEHAAVIDWPANPKGGMSHARVLRQGTNGWTCMPDIPGRPQHDPMCADETMMKWLMATLAGKKPDIDRVGLSYMLAGEARQGQGATPAKDPSQVKHWFYIGPHIMVVLPDSAKDERRGINQDLSNNQPYTPGSSATSARRSTRSRATMRSAPSSSPAARRRSPPAPTSRKWPAKPIWTPISPIS